MGSYTLYTGTYMPHTLLTSIAADVRDERQCIHAGVVHADHHRLCI